MGAMVAFMCFSRNSDIAFKVNIILLESLLLLVFQMCAASLGSRIQDFKTLKVYLILGHTTETPTIAIVQIIIASPPE